MTRSLPSTRAGGQDDVSSQANSLKQGQTHRMQDAGSTYASQPGGPSKEGLEDFADFYMSQIIRNCSHANLL